MLDHRGSRGSRHSPRSRRLTDVLRQRRATAVVALATALGLTIAAPPRPLLVWNASASAAIGLYAVSWNAPIESGDMVVAMIPEGVRRLASERSYLPAGVPVVKHVAATAGDLVCARGRGIYLNAVWAAGRRAVDPAGQKMPWWRGCVRLRNGQLFLLNPDVPESFDGRYFGISRSREVIGRARLIWPQRQ